MTPIGYQWWALLPTDPEPATGEAALQNPPMLTVLALDPHASLVFHFTRQPGPLQVAVEVTSLSAENHGGQVLGAYTGNDPARLGHAQRSDWQLHQDGLYTVLAATVSDVGNYLKLRLEEPGTLIVNRIDFTRP
jgi:hypothetical protein